MKELSGIILVWVMVLSVGTLAFATESNNGNLYGWENGKQNPHKTVPQEEINAIDAPFTSALNVWALTLNGSKNLSAVKGYSESMKESRND